MRHASQRVAAAGHARVVEATSRRERGDMPGWVMITVMTATIVVALLLVARPALEGAFEDAIDRVTGAR